MSKQNNSLPEDMEWVIPYLVYQDAGNAIDWLTHTFGFTERKDKRDTGENGSVIHAELEHNGDLIMLGGKGPDFEPQQEQNIMLYLYVDDVKAHFRHAKESGAEIIMEPEDTDYGDRRYWAKDPGGHMWLFAQRMENPG